MPPFAHSEQHPRPPQRPRRHRRIGIDQLVDAYLTAHDAVVAAGFAAEIDWQDRQCIDGVDESEFLREAAWVILSAGMRENVVRDRFGEITTAFLEWESAEAIARTRRRCVRRALPAFRHPGKIGAIGDVAAFVADVGFEVFRSRLRSDGLNELQQLPFIGPVTRFHLAKNLGLDVVKPDRHLVRMARAAGLTGPEAMCRLVAEVTGDRLATVDVVLWRFATLEPGYVKWFQAGSSHRRTSARAATVEDACVAV